MPSPVYQLQVCLRVLPQLGNHAVQKGLWPAVGRLNRSKKDSLSEVPTGVLQGILGSAGIVKFNFEQFPAAATAPALPDGHATASHLGKRDMDMTVSIKP